MQITTIKIKQEEVEVTTDLINFYKSNTRKKRITKKGIEKFFNSFYEKFEKYLIF
jgi:hypothetical protein